MQVFEPVSPALRSDQCLRLLCPPPLLGDAGREVRLIPVVVAHRLIGYAAKWSSNSMMRCRHLVSSESLPEATYLMMQGPSTLVS